MALQKDLTVGKPSQLVLQFSVPVILGNIFQQFYSMTDTIIVGKFVGTSALAAVGSTGMITFLILGFMWGLCAGFAVPIGQKFGAGDLPAMRLATGTAAVLSVVFTVLITAASMYWMRDLLTLLNTPDDIYEMAYDYVIVICAGFGAQMLYTMVATILRSLGNSRIPLIFLIISACLNIVLDLVFILCFHMGVAGAAWATVVSQGISGIACLIFIILKVPVLHLSARDLVPDRNLAGNELKLGLPMALQFSITAIGTLMVQSSLNLLGSTTVAAYTAAGKIEQLLEQLFTGLGITMSSYCAQNYGAGKLDRVRQGVKAANVQNALSAALASVGCLTFGKYLTYLFVSDGIAEIMPMVDLYLKCIAFFMIPLGMIFIFRNAMQGMGYSFLPMMGGVVELASRTVFAYVSAEYRSFLLVCLANPVTWLVTAIFLLVCYMIVMRRIRKKWTDRHNDKVEKASC